MNLGYCVVFSYLEQGSIGLTVVVTSDSLPHAIDITEKVSGYPRDHERYTQKIYDLTNMYHRKALGELDPKQFQELKGHSPEACEAIEKVKLVKYSVQAYEPLGIRCWINRLWSTVTDAVTSTLKTRSTERSIKRQLERKQTIAS